MIFEEREDKYETDHTRQLSKIEPKTTWIRKRLYDHWDSVLGRYDI